MAQNYIQTLISAERNVNLEACEMRAAEVTASCPTPWSVRKVRLHGGRQEGVDLIVVDNGRLTMRIAATRGMGIVDVTMGDMRLGWDSPVKEVVHPMYVEQTRRGGTGWLEGFGEYVVRCGLEWFGPPCADGYHGAVGEPPAGNLTLHGKVANIPASEVAVEIERRKPWRITVRGVVNEVMMYGPKLRLTTAITTEAGSSGFTVRDTVENLGGQTQEMSLLYHINHGRPLLGDGSRLVAAVKSVCPRDAGYAARDVTHWDRFGGPRPGAPEQVFLCRLYAGRDGRTGALLHNKARDRAVEVSWPLKALPCFTLWKGIHDERDGYVVGLEPATCYPLARPVEREAGRMVELGAGRKWAATLGFALHGDRSAVREGIKRIEGLGRGRARKLSRSAGDGVG